MKLREKVERQGGTSLDLDEIVELQDEIARMRPTQVIEYWQTLNEAQRKIFIWVVFRVVSMDTACDILEQTVTADMVNKLRSTREALNAERQSLADTFVEHVSLRRRVEALESELAQERREAANLLDEYETLQVRMKKLESLRDEVARLHSSLSITARLTHELEGTYDD